MINTQKLSLTTFTQTNRQREQDVDREK